MTKCRFSWLDTNLSSSEAFPLAMYYYYKNNNYNYGTLNQDEVFHVR